MNTAGRHRDDFRIRSLGIGLILLAAIRFPGFAADLAPKVDYARDIRPILSDRCYRCHGPDEKSRKAKLRLDLPEGFSKVVDEKKGLKVFFPGNTNLSEAFRRITTDDPDDKMPPPKSKLSLAPNEIVLIQKWIEQGAIAKSKPHWAFVAVQPVALPKGSTNGTVRNSIDLFIQVRLVKERLKPSSEASREALIRRVSLGLTGLPPTPQEISRFVNDPNPLAYERLVERLLDSPAYGERMAGEWLDVARYADTYGYQADVDRDMSPWRDWVIRAFNSNLSYDKFILWQVAGDLLPNATREQQLATAFNRLHRQTNEGGSIEEEFRNEYVSDRVHTFGTAFLGLTLECCRCHDHKYDPLPQKDYYRLSAFFNNIDESGLYSHFTRAVPTPTLLMYSDAAKLKHEEIARKVSFLEKELLVARLEAFSRFEQWKPPQRIEVPAIAAYAFDSAGTNGSPNSIDPSKPASLSDNPAFVDGHFGKAVQFSGDNEVVCKGVAHFGRTQPFSFSLWLNPAESQERAVIFHHSRAWTDSASRGYELVLENGHPTFALIHFYPGNAIRVAATNALPTNQWSHLVVSYDGSSRATGIQLFLNGNRLGTEIIRDNLYKDIQHRAEWGDAEAGAIDLRIGARFRDSGFRGGRVDEFQVFDRELSPPEIQTLAGRSLDQVTREDWFAYYLSREDSLFGKSLATLHSAREEENRIINDIPEIMVMKELGKPRPTFVLKRGSYTTPGEAVTAGTPDGIFPKPGSSPQNRLDLARWLLDPRNPLTARVAVNRIWRLHFGRGLVATQEDFGNQGRLPTHPELLDWLAGEFTKSGWDVKALHRLIVTSATYRQTSIATAESFAADPENLLLSRGPKQRLQAEQVRDAALAASGLLSRKLGGPSVKPYQPAGLWEEAGTGKSYSQDTGEKLYRRSLYTFWRRTAPPPTMLTFDATSREVCTARRESTTTPLQSLVLLNDPQFVEAARVLAARVIEETQSGTVEDRINAASQRVLGRLPSTKETGILKQLYAEQLAYFEAHPSDAGKLLATGDLPFDKSIPANNLAAMTMIAGTLFNHDEFVMNR